MHLLLVQKDTNETDITPYLDLAEARRVDLVLFGELALSGAIYQPRPVEPLEAYVARFASYDVGIMVGLPHKTPEGVYNSYLYYHRGKHSLYHKINLFPGMNEPTVYLAGKTPGVFDTPFGKIGASICYDVRFPEVYRALSDSGIDKIVVPAAFPLVRIDDYRHLLIERARENGVTIIAVNCVGDDGTNVFGGNSMVVSPDGSILAEADRRTPTILEVNI